MVVGDDEDEDERFHMHHNRGYGQGLDWSDCSDEDIEFGNLVMMEDDADQDNSSYYSDDSNTESDEAEAENDSNKYDGDSMTQAGNETVSKTGEYFFDNFSVQTLPPLKFITN